MLNEIELPEALEKQGESDPKALNRKIQALERLLEISRQVSTLDYREVLRHIMKCIIEMTEAKRGMLMLREPKGGLKFGFSVNIDRAQIESDEFEISRSIAERAADSGQVLVVKNVPTTGLSGQPRSFIVLGLKAVMAIPLISRKQVVGVIYIDTDSANHKITEGDQSIYKGFGSQAAIALENARLHEKLREDYFYLKRTMAGASSFDQIVYQSAAMQRVCNAIKQVLTNDITVLVTGDTGTGKELVARAVHYNGLRKDRRFLSQNAGALPDTIIESELFGHRRGAFSGAFENKTGLFEVADGGTVFLDEIGEASPALQVRLLRLLETGTFRRVGDTTTRKTDVRIIAATNRDLKKEVEEGRFREDLYYRLSVFPVELPPLRERREDIPLLVQHFVKGFNEDLNKAVTSVPKLVMNDLMSREWKGNIRELRNVVHRLMVLTPADSDMLAPDHAAPKSAATSSPAYTHTPIAEMGEGEQSRIKTLEEVEREHIRYTLERTGGNQVQAARHLGLNRSTFRWRLKKLGLN